MFSSAVNDTTIHVPCDRAPHRVKKEVSDDPTMDNVFKGVPQRKPKDAITQHRQHRQRTAQEQRHRLQRNYTHGAAQVFAPPPPGVSNCNDDLPTTRRPKDERPDYNHIINRSKWILGIAGRWRNRALRKIQNIHDILTRRLTVSLTCMEVQCSKKKKKKVLCEMDSTNLRFCYWTQRSMSRAMCTKCTRLYICQVASTTLALTFHSIKFTMLCTHNTLVHTPPYCFTPSSLRCCVRTTLLYTHRRIVSLHQVYDVVYAQHSCTRTAVLFHSIKFTMFAQHSCTRTAVLFKRTRNSYVRATQ